MKNLLQEIRNCRQCVTELPLGANPVLAASHSSKIAIIGQAPGRIVHASGIPWQDKSGDRLRDWLGVSTKSFYDTHIFAIVPMGFCYPGKGKSGDLPPRAECAPLWHSALLASMPDLQLTLLVGAYAQAYYLGDRKKKTLTETVKCFREYLPKYVPLPHPSPRNNIWLRKNPWFDQEVLPFLQKQIKQIEI